MSARGAYGRLWSGWIKGHWQLIVLSVFFMIVIALTTAGYAKFMEFAISGLESADPTVMYWAPLSIVALTLTRSVAHYLNVNLQNRILSSVQADLQKKMYDSLVDMDLSKLLAESPAAIAARFSADISVVLGATSAVFGSVRDVLTVIATVIVMLSIDWAMTLGLLCIFVLVFLPVGIAGSRIREISKSVQEEIADMTKSVNEGLSCIRMVRTYQLEDKMKRNARVNFDSLFRLRIRLVKWQSSLSPLVEALAGIAVAVTLFQAAVRIQSGAIDIAGMIGLITALGVLTNPGRKLSQAFAVGSQGVAALERVYGLFDTKNQIKGGEQTLTDRAEGRIEFRDVGFTYPDGYKALNDINLTIEPGQTFAFVGRSGAGKSTVFNLLPRLFDTTDGQILLDGQDITKLTLNSLRDQISMVSQDSTLLSGTVVENIGFGRDEASREVCIQAAKDAQAHDFIEKLPNGYDTYIEPNKAKFSGGERQRLSIARAIVRNAPVLLLDEPTSALDAESESTIRDALTRLSVGRTTLVIAHRFSTILHADKIIVMDQGRVVATGTHSELMDTSPLYEELFNLQFEPSSGGVRGRGRRGEKPDKIVVGPVERVFRMLGFGGPQI